MGKMSLVRGKKREPFIILTEKKKFLNLGLIMLKVSKNTE